MRLGTDVLRPPLHVSAQLVEVELNFTQDWSLWFLQVLLRQEREARTHQASSPAWCCLFVAREFTQPCHSAGSDTAQAGGSQRPLC